MSFKKRVEFQKPRKINRFGVLRKNALSSVKAHKNSNWKYFRETLSGKLSRKLQSFAKVKIIKVAGINRRDALSSRISSRLVGIFASARFIGKLNFYHWRNSEFPRKNFHVRVRDENFLAKKPRQPTSSQCHCVVALLPLIGPKSIGRRPISGK